MKISAMFIKSDRNKDRKLQVKKQIKFYHSCHLAKQYHKPITQM
jgi:hypothetical protein